jgi:hypothetical protein
VVTTPAEGVGLDMRDMKTRIVFCVLNTMYPHEYKTLASPVSSPRLARSFTRARTHHRSPSRAASRARPTPDLERGDARARFASTRNERRARRPPESREDVEKSIPTTRERIYPKLTVDDRFDARERRAIRAMREDAS